jgi:hypothetical protein
MVTVEETGASGTDDDLIRTILAVGHYENRITVASHGNMAGWPAWMVYELVGYLCRRRSDGYAPSLPRTVAGSTGQRWTRVLWAYPLWTIGSTAAGRATPGPGTIDPNQR